MPDSDLADDAVLTSSFYNTYIRQQVIVTCTSASRPSSVEGRVIYEADTDRVMCYTGSSWSVVVEPIQSWSPTITQGSAVSGTVNRGWYQRSYGKFEGVFLWTASTAGTASNAITVSLPFTILNTGDVGGSFWYHDNGTAVVGYAYGDTTATLKLIIDGATSSLGVSSPTIASGDTLRVQIAGRYS